MKREQSLITSAAWSSKFIIILLSGLSCHSFQPQHPNSQSSSFASLYSTKSSDTDTNYQPFNLQEYEDSSPPKENNENNHNGVEIWLDLRGTSLSPSTALELWELEQNDDYTNNIYEKLTVPFTKCLISNDNINTEKELNAQHDNPIQVLVDHSRGTQQQQQSWGQTLQLQINPQSSLPILPDPLPAMELVSQGQFVLLDTTAGWKKVEEEERLSYLLPLAELISSGALPAAGGGAAGGIGFTCLTRNEVVKVAMWIQSVTNNTHGDGGTIQNVRVKTLDNGLVIPDYNNDDVTADLQQMSGTSRQAGIQYAIVVPYDVGLIKTASMLLRNEGF